jgi:hypothetical protein
MSRLTASNICFSESRIFMELSDGRIIGCPTQWFPRLDKAPTEQKNKWELIAGGTGVHWEDLDEDLSVEGMLTFRK